MYNEKLLKKYKRQNILHLFITIAFFMCTLFFIIYGYMGINATRELITLKEITYDELIETINLFWFVIIILSAFLTFVWGYFYWSIRKLLVNSEISK